MSMAQSLTIGYSKTILWLLVYIIIMKAKMYSNLMVRFCVKATKIFVNYVKVNTLLCKICDSHGGQTLPFPTGVHTDLMLEKELNYDG